MNLWSCSCCSTRGIWFREAIEFEANKLHLFHFDVSILVALELLHFSIADFTAMSLVFFGYCPGHLVVCTDAEPGHGLFPTFDSGVTQEVFDGSIDWSVLSDVGDLSEHWFPGSFVLVDPAIAYFGEFSALVCHQSTKCQEMNVM